MHARAPAAGAEHQIAVDTAALARPVRRRDERRLDRPGAGDAHHRVSAQDLDPALGKPGDERLGRLLPDVREHRHVDSRLDELQDRAIRRVVVGDRDRPVTRTHPVATDVGEGRGREHHPRAIVVFEHQGPLCRAGGQNHAPRPHLPQPFVDPRLLGRRLHDGEEVVVVVAGDGGPRKPNHVRDGVELRSRGRRPFGRGAPVDDRRTVEEHSAGCRPVVDNQNPGAAAGRCQRRLKSRRTRPRNQHVAMVEAFLVCVPSGAAGGVSQSGHATHQPPVEVPAAGKSHECLVVEPGREQPGQSVADGAQVEADARPAVDAACAQAFPERKGRRPDVGLVVVAVELHDGVGLLGAGRDDPPRAVVLEAAPDQPHPIGDQRRCERVAGVAFAFPPVESEPKPGRTIDEGPALGEPVWLDAAHCGFECMLARARAGRQSARLRHRCEGRAVYQARIGGAAMPREARGDATGTRRRETKRAPRHPRDARGRMSNRAGIRT